MRGTIYHIDKNSKKYFVKLDNGDFTVFELNDLIDIRIGDIIIGDLNLYGLNYLTNQTQGLKFMADIINSMISESDAESLM